MRAKNSVSSRLVLAVVLVITTLLLLTSTSGWFGLLEAQEPARPETRDFEQQYQKTVKPLLQKYCLTCHSTESKKGSLDLERFAGLEHIRKDLKPWQNLIEQIETGEMPPAKKPQLTEAEKKQLLSWVKEYLDHEAKSRSGDPGHVPLRRLSNAEYDNTIRDLTGVDLRPTREFPPDGAAGEGFTNAAEALTDISPALLAKYLNAAKELASHVVLLPDGFRFSLAKTRRDWTDEGTRRLQKFYASVAPADGKLLWQPYLIATVRHREAIQKGKRTFQEVATTEKLHAKYLDILWNALSSTTPSPVLDPIRKKWAVATEADVPALSNEITRCQTVLWKTNNVANYIQSTPAGFAECLTRQLPFVPAIAESTPLRMSYKPVPGQNEAVLYLSTQDLLPVTDVARVIWQKPRLEALGKPPLLLADYDSFRDEYEVDYASVFHNTAKYLEAVAEKVRVPSSKVEILASSHGIDAPFLQRWLEVLAVDSGSLGRVVPLVAFQPLEEKLERVGNKAWVNGWKKKGAELPILASNSSDTEEHIPGRAAPHGVVVHPMPQECVAVVWKSPLAGKVKISTRVASAHPACGNGVAWWLEHRNGERAVMFAEGAIGVGGSAKADGKSLTLNSGDQVILGIDARNGDHGCDLTDIALTIQEDKPGGREWNLAGDINSSVLDGNPHADRHGNRDTWSFVYGPARQVIASVAAMIPAGSLLDRWRTALGKPTQQPELKELGTKIQAMLSGPRVAKDKDPNSLLYDNLVALDGPLFQGVAPVKLGKKPANANRFGLPATHVHNGDLAVDANTVTVIRLPAALLQGRELIMEGKLEKPDSQRVVQMQLPMNTPGMEKIWDGKSTLIADKEGQGVKQLLQGMNEFRQLFPLYLCYPNVIPNDEVVSIKMFHREDEPLNRLILSEEQVRQVDAWWKEHQFVSRQAKAEFDYLPQFIGYVSQDGAPGMLEYFKAQLPKFKERADAARQIEETAEARQLEAVLPFAARAFRRPLSPSEQSELTKLYRDLRAKGVSHEEAFQGLITRIFVSPAFLFRVEQSPTGKEPALVNDWELASRLSYFLWSSSPDEELRNLAARGELQNEKVLLKQLERMLQDERLRMLAIEFGTQWIHVRGFDEHNEKNEKLFPMFDAALRQAMYEESILFFKDLFQKDRSVASLLDSDATYLNELLARHYGIPGVKGEQWRLVTQIKQYGRGGLLGLASVQASQSGASRTSPILRGNWVVETLLGEKLPKPPPNVPKLPEEEGTDKLTMKQLVQKHTSVAECASCHQRIDPFGFALEKYDPIGRRREKDLGGLPVDANAVIKDGTSFDDLDGLRKYLLTRKKESIVRLFCKRLAGYALGRSISLSDTALLDKMVAALHQNDGRISAALKVLVLSPQFRMVRGSETSEH
ncbi:MAG: DUF1592 domain-containing protein [Planctomycetia bacterium]|nr:DUF1592 domain-containing protein [Planctomycetia bacterium]